MNRHNIRMLIWKIRLKMWWYKLKLRWFTKDYSDDYTRNQGDWN